MLNLPSDAGRVRTARNGVLIAYEEGNPPLLSLKGAEDRGQFLLTPGTKVYKE